MSDYKPGPLVGTLTLDVRQAALLRERLNEEEDDGLLDVKRRLDELLGEEHEPIIFPADTPCLNCGGALEIHFPDPPAGCEGFRFAALAAGGET